MKFLLNVFKHYNYKMDYKEKEQEIIKATKVFAIANNIHYDILTETMILNAMRELNKFFTHVSNNEVAVCDSKKPIKLDTAANNPYDLSKIKRKVN